MTRCTILAAAVCGCVTSSSFGGFVATSTRVSENATLDRIDLWARNTGGDTGVGLIAFELTSSATSGVALFRSTAAGNWNPLNSADTALRSQFRVDPEDVSSSILVSKTPSANQPLAPQYGASTVALGNFGVVIAGLSGAIPPQSATQGNLFASLYVSKNFASTISGNLGGSTGPKVGFSFQGCRCSPIPPPVIIPGASANVVFGQTVSGGAAFSVDITVTSVNVLDILSLTVAQLPGLSNVLVTTNSAMSPAKFTVTGIVSYAYNGMSVLVPITATNGTTSSNGSFTLNVTPEPSALGILGLCGFVRRQR